MQRYQALSMRYDHRTTTTNSVTASDMSDWGKSYVASPPSSKYGEDDSLSTFTNSRQRRSRLDKDITQPQTPLMLPPLRPLSSRKSFAKNNGSHRGIDPNLVNGRRSAGPVVSHNSTFNGYDLNSYQRNAQYPSACNGNESFSKRYPSYAAEYFNIRNNVGILPNKMREPKRPRSITAEKYSESLKKASGFGGGYESGELSTTSDEKGSRQRSEESDIEEEDDVNDDEEEEMRKYFLQSKRAQKSRSVTNTIRADPFVEGGEAYYFGVVHLDLELVAHVIKTFPPPQEYYDLQPIEKVAYIFYCAVYKKPYLNIEEFHKRFNREFYKFVCSGDSSDLALFKICKSMQDQYTLRQLEASKRAYEKAQKEALENEKLDFNQHRLEASEDHHVAISQPEEVLSYGPLKFHSGHAFSTFGVGGKMVVVRPAGMTDPVSGAVFSSANVVVEDVRTMLNHDELTSKVIESIQSFKGPLIAGQTPTHSVRLYIQRQIDALRMVGKNGEVRKSEVMDALLIWQLLEIMVQQHGRVTGPDVATLLTNASEELAEKTGVLENGSLNGSTNRAEAKERFNKFLLGGHINEAVESAITDGLYADAMTLIRRLHPNDLKKIEEIETRFIQLRSIDDPFATLVAVSSDQPPPILTSSSFDDDNNWKRHAAIVLANLNTPAAMQTIYHLGLMLSKRERNCAADFCLLVVCILAGYDPFLPQAHVEGEEKSRKHIDLIHSGSNLLNYVDGLSESSIFSFTDLHATDIFDYALRLSNNNIDSPLAKSKEYQLARIEYAKRLSSYGGFATDAFKYCTEIARSLWPHVGGFQRENLLELSDLAEELQYVAAASSAEIEWISSLRLMLGAKENVEQTDNSQQEINENQQETLSFEARKWHDEHQAPIEMLKQVKLEGQPVNELSQQRQPLSPISEKTLSDYESNVTKSESTTTPSTTTVEDLSKTITSFSSESNEPSALPPSVIPSLVTPSLPPPPPTRPLTTTTSTEEQVLTPRAAKKTFESVTKSPDYMTPISSPPSLPPQSTMPVAMTNQQRKTEEVPKSPRSELEELWSAAPLPPPVQTPHQAAAIPSAAQPPLPPMMSHEGERKTSIPTPTTKPIPTKNVDQSIMKSTEERKTMTSSSSRGWFGSIKEKVIKSIPSTNQMILPDDSQPSIVWDPVKKKYVGAGVEEEVAVAPPPVMSAPHLETPNGGMSNMSSTNSLRNARIGGGSRYFQAPIGEQNNGGGVSPPMEMMAPPTLEPPAMNFGFIPAANDDESSEGFDPFSGEANPTISNNSSTEK